MFYFLYKVFPGTVVALYTLNLPDNSIGWHLGYNLVVS